MKLKRPLLLILLMLLLTQMSYTEPPTGSKIEESSDYGIELEQLYPGWMILEIIAVAENEIEKTADEAYAEGYKAGLLASAPDTAYYKKLTEMIQAELDTEKNKHKVPWQTVPIAGVFCFFAGALTYGLITR